ncbi:MAG: hypothetical protein AABW88_03970 [Nanoarchaeota archaeon]
MDTEIIDIDGGLDLDSRVIKTLAVRAGRQWSRIIADKMLLSQKQRIKVTKMANPLRKYKAKEVTIALSYDEQCKSYMSLLNMEEALATIDAATEKIAMNSNRTYADEIPKVIISGEFRNYMKAPESPRRELRDKLLTAYVDALELMGLAPKLIQKYAK